MSKLQHAFNLTLFLLAIWLLLSGHYNPLMILFGLLYTLIVVILTARTDLIDREIQPALIKPSVMFYWFWLGREIIKSNIDVARRILSPGLPISLNIFPGRATGRCLCLQGRGLCLYPGRGNP